MAAGSALVFDGGGSGCRAAWFDAEGKRIDGWSGPPCNLRRTPPEQIAARLEAARVQLAPGAGDPHAAVGLAGCGLRSEAEAFESELRRHLSKAWGRIRVGSDLELAWAGALGGESGILVLAGTGSAGVCLDRAGQERRSGGLGPRWDDRGSGFALGAAAVRRALSEWDGRLTETAWLGGVVERLRLQDGEALASAVRTDSLAIAEVARLAPWVLEQAEVGDDLAQEWASEVVAELVRCISALRPHVAPESGVSWSGGLLAGNDWLRQRWQAEAEHAIPGLGWIEPRGDALEGGRWLLQAGRGRL